MGFSEGFAWEVNRRLRGEAHRLVYHSTLGSRVIKEKKKGEANLGACSSSLC